MSSVKSISTQSAYPQQIAWILCDITCSDFAKTLYNIMCIYSFVWMTLCSCGAKTSGNALQFGLCLESSHLWCGWTPFVCIQTSVCLVLFHPFLVSLRWASSFCHASFPIHRNPHEHLRLWAKICSQSFSLPLSWMFLGHCKFSWEGPDDGSQRTAHSSSLPLIPQVDQTGRGLMGKESKLDVDGTSTGLLRKAWRAMGQKVKVWGLIVASNFFKLYF